ncbi:MAG: hypothetical protein OCC49_14250 [Fibrobacterales bacterium]
MAAVLDFNQDWQFCLDGDGIGLDKRWHVNSPSGTETVTLPHTWKKNTLKSTDNVGFYFKTFSFEDPTLVKKVILKLEKVFMKFSIWSNGVLVQEVLSGYKPAEINLTKFIDIEKENTICIRVSTLNGTLDFEGHASCDVAHGALFEQSPFGGIWGSAQLVYWKKACILDVNIIPDYDGKKIRVETRFSNSKNFNAKIHYVLTAPDGPIGMNTIETKLDKENAIHKTQFNIKDPVFWTLEEPELYVIEVYLEMSFGVTKKFGLRKSDVLRGDFYLNDKIVKIRGVNFTNSYALTGALPESTKSLRSELVTIKALGFNLIKSGGSPMSNAALTICDELGLFVIQEMPIHRQKASKEALELARDFIEAIINYQKTHPSVIAWSLGSDNGTLMLENGTKLLKHTDKIDEARVVFSNLNAVFISGEGEYDSDTGKVLGITNEKVSLYNSHELHPEMSVNKKQSHFLSEYCNKASDITEVPNKYFGDEDFHDHYETMYKGLTGKILVTTNNHTLFPDFKEVYKYLKAHKGTDVYKKLYSFEKEIKALAAEPVFKTIWDTHEDFIADANTLATKAIINKVNAIRSNEQSSGFILDSWADTKQIMNGLADLTHQPKSCIPPLKEVTSVSQIIVHNLDRAVETGSEINFNLTLLNELRVAPFSLTLQVLNEKGKVIESKDVKITPEGLVFKMGAFTLPAPSSKGLYTVTAAISNNPGNIGTFSDAVIVLNKPTNYLKGITTLTEFTNDDERLNAIRKAGNTILIHDVADYSSEIIQALFDTAETGTTVLINALNENDAHVLNKSKRLNTELIATPTSGSNGAAYHYFSTDGVLKNITHTRIADGTLSEVIPAHSLNPIKDAAIEACCINITNGNIITQHVDVQTISYGSGSIVFNQYQIGDKLDSSILAQVIIAK